MPTLTEQSLTFHFPDHWLVTKYDDWSFYKNQFKDCCKGCKAVDFLAIDPVRKELWLIEVKNYQYYRRLKDEKIMIWDEIALKVLHTLAGLVAVKMSDSAEMNNFAKECLKCRHLMVAFHLEQSQKNSKSFPRVYDPSKVQQKLKQLIKPIHAQPKVTELGSKGVTWRVESVGVGEE